MTQKTIPENTRFLVEETTAFDSLTISEGACLTAPEGKRLTLTTDGIETAIRPGTYTQAVLTVTDAYQTPVENQRGELFRTALYVEDGEINKVRSVPAALSGGRYDGTSMEGVSIESQGPLFTGVIVDRGSYQIRDLTIHMTGYGGNDFGGIGTGLVAAGNANVTVDGYTVRNRGVIRNAVLVGGTANVHIKNADIEVYGGTQEEEDEARSVAGRAMYKVPWALGLTGRNRATNVVGKGKVLYENSRIRAESWGVLSTDGVDAPERLGDYSVLLNTKDCLVELFGESGYGSYAIGACRNTFDHTSIRVPDYALIVANEYASGQFVNGTVVSSERFGIMWHQNQGGKTLLDQAVFHTKLTTFLIKGCYPDILVRDSIIKADNGILLQLIDLDDPGLGGDGIDVDSTVPVLVEEHDSHNPNYHDGMLYSKPVEHILTDAQVTFERMNLNGDIYNSTTNRQGVGMVVPSIHPSEPLSDKNTAPMPEPQKATEFPVNLLVNLKDTKLTGTISASVSMHAKRHIEKEDYKLLGVVQDTPAPAVNNGVLVSLDSRSVWTVTGTSYLTSLTIAPGAVIQSPTGSTVSMTVDGDAVTVQPGTVQGNICIRID